MKGDSQRVQHGVHVPIERVLFPTDLSHHAAAAWPWATGLAREGRAELHVLHALDGGPPLTATTSVAGVPIQVQTRLGELASAARELGIRTRTHTTYGDPASEVVTYAREHGIGAIVMSTTGRTGSAHVLIGSVAEQVVRHADCPVVTVRDDAAFARSRAAREELPRLRRILVPLDGSRLAEALLPHIVRLAKRQRAMLMLLRVADAHSVREVEVQGLHEAETYLAGVAHRLAAEGVSASPLVRCGGTAEEILDDIWDRHPDLVAMTTHGRTGLTHLLLGSIAEEVLRASPVPVLLFPPRALRVIDARQATDKRSCEWNYASQSRWHPSARQSRQAAEKGAGPR